MLRGNLNGALLQFFPHSVDHLQLPARRFSDVKNMSSLQALNTSPPVLWLMPKATAVPLLIGLKLEVILDWGLRHWHAAPVSALTLMFPYNFRDQTSRLAAAEWAEKVERFRSCTSARRNVTRRHKLHTSLTSVTADVSHPCPVAHLRLQELTSKRRFWY